MSATEKWIDILIDTLSYEFQHINDGELLSESCDKWIESRPVLARTIIGITGLLLTLHLGNFLPSYIDPLSKGFWRKVLVRGTHIGLDTTPNTPPA